MRSEDSVQPFKSQVSTCGRNKGSSIFWCITTSASDDALMSVKVRFLSEKSSIDPIIPPAHPDDCNLSSFLDFSIQVPIFSSYSPTCPSPPSYFSGPLSSSLPSSKVQQLGVANPRGAHFPPAEANVPWSFSPHWQTFLKVMQRVERQTKRKHQIFTK